jgi:hypothetical protein
MPTMKYGIHRKIKDIKSQLAAKRMLNSLEEIRRNDEIMKA